jgi:hypothetical protein
MTTGRYPYKTFYRYTNSDVMISFPKRMLMVVSVILILANLVIFARVYWFNLPLWIALVITIVEILAIALSFAYWAPKYKLKW